MAILDRASDDGRSFLAAFRTCGIGLLLTAVLVFGVTPTVGTAAGASPQELQAAYLFNFARYVEWPASAFGSPTSPIRICVLGPRGLIGVIEKTIGDRRAGERPVKVEQRASVADAQSCHILFIGADETEAQKEAILTLSNRGVFTVAEAKGFARRGGVANFILVDKKIRFEINKGAADRAGLKISSRLLRVAQLVE